MSSFHTMVRRTISGDPERTLAFPGIFLLEVVSRIVVVVVNGSMIERFA